MRMQNQVVSNKKCLKISVPGCQNTICGGGEEVLCGKLHRNILVSIYTWDLSSDCTLISKFKKDSRYF